MAFTPTVPPLFDNITDLQRWLGEEFARLATALNEIREVELRPSFVAPSKPREGMIISADGVNWNPGAGAGAYEYKAGAWVKL